MPLLLASNNQHKLRELRTLLGQAGFTVVSPAAIGLKLDVAETGETFARNAALKAGAFADASGLLTLGDDSGLQVEALNGEPGIYSARYAGPNASDDQRVALLLDRLGDRDDRLARFVCSIAIARPGEVVHIVEGTVEGEIAREPAGHGGFGYDPIFIYPALGKTFAQLSEGEKAAVSHRGRAIRDAAEYLKTLSHSSTMH
ncbi:MAG: RdgB/HAM1 family non-canonical purine NTP pyrophosphatase [Chloroflexota bacterium]